MLLYESMSRGEHNLLRDGAERLVLDARFQALRVIGQEVRDSVAEVVARPVVAVLAAQSASPDVASLTFVLHPERADLTAH